MNKVDWGRFAIMTAGAIAMACTAVLLSNGGAIDEDGPIEAASAAIFFLAAVAGFLRVHLDHADRALLTTLSAVALLAALDELSFGARHLGWEPYVIAGVPIDGAHDFLTVAWRLLQWSPIWLKVVALTAAVAGTLWTAWLAWRFRRRIEAAWLQVDQPLVATASAAAIVVLAAQLMDIAPSPTIGGSADLVEETLELAGSLLTLAATTGVACRLSRTASPA